MKILIPVCLAVFVGLCNIPYVYGFKKAFSQNPYIFAACFNIISGLVLLSISLLYGKIEKQYLINNFFPIVSATTGIVVINILAYFIITRHGASYWMIASLSNVLIPASVVGFIFLKEKVNFWIIPSFIFAILSVFFFYLSKK